MTKMPKKKSFGRFILPIFAAGLSENPFDSFSQLQFLRIHFTHFGGCNFQKYILSRILFAAHLPGLGLYAIYCQDKFNFDVSQAGIFTILNVLASGLTSYVVGILGDKMGHKSGMLVAYLAHFTAVFLAIFSQNMLCRNLIYVYFV